VQLVSTIASKIQVPYSESSEEQFFTGLGNVLKSEQISAKSTTPDELLFSALDKAYWDCDTLSFLVFDVLRQLGIKSRIILIAEHTYIGTAKGYFETTNLEYYRGDVLPNHTCVRYYDGSDIEKINAITYNVLGLWYRLGKKNTFHGLASIIGLESKIDNSLRCYTEAIRLIPGYAVAYNNRGNRYRALYYFDQAIRDLTKSIMIDPEYSTPHKNRGRAYAQNDLPKEAIKDLEEAIRRETDLKEKEELELNLQQQRLKISLLHQPRL
jgi:tetratricopeptide (TPR) repeat protein